MLERLKSLPLTIALTLLIWLYAESQVRTAPENATRDVADVPVWFGGPPTFLDSIDVIVIPRSVTVTVSGTKEGLDALQKHPVSAYLDIDPVDMDSPGAGGKRILRFMLPEGVKVVNPPEVTFRLVEKKNATTRRAGG